MNKDFQQKYFWIKTKGKSMIPFIKEGQRLLVEGRLFSKIKRGDIIAIKGQKEIIVHRLIRKYQMGGKLYFQEKGDCNLSGRMVTAEDILGKVILIKSQHKEINLNQPGWQILNKILALYGQFILFLYQIFRKLK